MKQMRIGKIKRFARTCSLSPSAFCSRVASFSVVTMMLGEGSASKVSLMSCTSLSLNTWWSAKVSVVRCGA